MTVAGVIEEDRETGQTQLIEVWPSDRQGKAGVYTVHLSPRLYVSTRIKLRHEMSIVSWYQAGIIDYSHFFVTRVSLTKGL
jgi:hypothetical protein